jgi:hypothetical protein
VNPGFPDPRSRGTQAPQALPSTTVAPAEIHTPVTRQLSLGVKRELIGGFAVSTDYVNSRGRNLYYAPDVNAPDPVTGRRPNTAFARITEYQSTGNSWYHGLLVGLERRAGGRWPQLGISYTLSKQTRDVEDFGFVPQNSLDREAEKGPALNDRRHQLVTNVVWALPAGFQIGLFAQARSALPFNVTTGTDNNRDTSTTTDRPDLANPDGDPRVVSTYNASFTGRVGNLPRNYARGDGYFEAHLRVSKFFNLSRAGLDRIELFAEALNLTNHVNFDRPEGSLRSTFFGRATQLHPDSSPRQVELGFRIDF